MLKIRFTAVIEVAQPVPNDTPTGSILEEMLAEPDSIEEIRKDWQKNLGIAGTVKEFDINEAGVIEV